MTCELCGTPMEPGRASKRFCGPKCRQRASRAARRPVGAPLAAVRSLPVQFVPADDGSLRAAVLRELTAAGHADGSLGRSALILAERIESGGEPGGAVATMVAQLRETLGAATKKQARSRLQDLRAAREREG